MRAFILGLILTLSSPVFSEEEETECVYSEVRTELMFQLKLEIIKAEYERRLEEKDQIIRDFSKPQLP